MSFTHAASGTPEQDWQRWAGLSDLAPLDGAPPHRVVVLAAHPDDETLGAGGLIAHLASAGSDVHVVVATAGEASHPRSSTVTPTELAERRAREVCDAVRELAPRAQVHLIGLPDGRLVEHRAQLVAVLQQLIEPGCWLVAPWRGDAHPDHDAAGQAASTVATIAGVRLLEYPVWAWHWATPGDRRLPWHAMRGLALSSQARRRKADAMARHQTQVRPLSQLPGDEALLAPGVLAHFERGVETFFDTQATSPGPDPQSMTADDFEKFYADSGDDPWGFLDRWYEKRKRALTLASLPRESFRRAYEPGCSIGVMTELLAPRCGQLLATDVSEAALAQARRRTSHLGHVRVERGSVPAQWPDGELDLVVLSELGYYCGPLDLARLSARAAASLAPDGVLVACHWRHPVPEYPLGGDEVHASLRAQPELELLAQHVEEDFLLDVLVRRPAASVARATGLLS